MTTPAGSPGASAAGVADQMWERVRRLAARAARLEEGAARDELDEDGRARLEALRVRCARAVDRARLADELADRMADAEGVRRERGRRREGA